MKRTAIKVSLWQRLNELRKKLTQSKKAQEALKRLKIVEAEKKVLEADLKRYKTIEAEKQAVEIELKEAQDSLRAAYHLDGAPTKRQRY